MRVRQDITTKSRFCDKWLSLNELRHCEISCFLRKIEWFLKVFGVFLRDFEGFSRVFLYLFWGREINVSQFKEGTKAQGHKGTKRKESIHRFHRFRREELWNRR